VDRYISPGEAWRRFLFGAFIFLGSICGIGLGVACLFLWLKGYHIVRQPSPDQIYGCTIAQQAPNGDCP